MSGAQSIATPRAYGVQRVCRVWARPRSSVYARRQTPRDCTLGQRRGPVGARRHDHHRGAGRDPIGTASSAAHPTASGRVTRRASSDPACREETE